MWICSHSNNFGMLFKRQHSMSSSYVPQQNLFCFYYWRKLILSSFFFSPYFLLMFNLKDTIKKKSLSMFCSVQFSRSVTSNSLRPHESQHAAPPCPSPTPRVYSNSCPSSQWCHPAISSSVVPFSSCPQSLPASGSFPMSQISSWGGQSIVVSASASVLPMNTQDWSPLGWTGWISLQSKGLSRVFANTKSLLNTHNTHVTCSK